MPDLTLKSTLDYMGDEILVDWYDHIRHYLLDHCVGVAMARNRGEPIRRNDSEMVDCCDHANQIRLMLKTEMIDRGIEPSPEQNECFESEGVRALLAHLEPTH